MKFLKPTMTLGNTYFEGQMSSRMKYLLSRMLSGDISEQELSELSEDFLRPEDIENIEDVIEPHYDESDVLYVDENSIIDNDDMDEILASSAPTIAWVIRSKIAPKN